MLDLISQHSTALKDPFLSHGYSGFLVYLSCLNALDEQIDLEKITHNTVIYIRDWIESQGVSNLSLFSGLAGICFGIHLCSKNRSRYQNLIKRLEAFLIEKLKENYLSVLQEKIHLNLPAYTELWEVVSGIVGIGAYFLSTMEHRDVLLEIISILGSLTKDIPIGAYKLPGWYQPNHYQFTEKDSVAYPLGNLNLGMAHGITGVLAFLSLTQMKGIYTKESQTAMDLIASWILEKKQCINNRYYWPNRISFEQETKISPIFHQEDYMDAWCYGTAGVSRALFIYGKAAQKATIQKEALDAFISIDTIPSSSTFCHGIAGLLTLTNLMKKDTGSEQLKQKAEDLKKILQQSPRTESEGLLDGNIGIQLALMDDAVLPLWTPIFLINSDV